MVRGLLVVALLATATPAQALEEWTATDTAFEVAGAALHLADWSQTLGIADDARGASRRSTPHFAETNPALGERPTRLEVHAYFAATLLAHVAVARVLPHPYRRVWQVAWVGLEATCVSYNVAGGVRFAF